MLDVKLIHSVTQNPEKLVAEQTNLIFYPSQNSEPSSSNCLQADLGERRHPAELTGSQLLAVRPWPILGEVSPIPSTRLRTVDPFSRDSRLRRR